MHVGPKDCRRTYRRKFEKSLNFKLELVDRNESASSSWQPKAGEKASKLFMKTGTEKIVNQRDARDKPGEKPGEKPVSHTSATHKDDGKREYPERRCEQQQGHRCRERQDATPS